MPSPDDDRAPNEKRLRLFSFAAHFARGLVRAQGARRQAMFWITLAALLVVFAGATFLAPVLDPRTRPIWFVVYWLVCAWLVATALLLALFDLLIVRARGREARRALAKKLADVSTKED